MPTDTATQIVLAGEIAVMAAGVGALWRRHLPQSVRTPASLTSGIVNVSV